MENTTLNTLICDYINDGKLLHLCTVINNQSWMCHVWYAPSKGLGKLYFTSNKGRRHSQEIEINPVVSGGIIAIELLGLGQKVRGLSFEGIARVANNIELDEAYNSYSERWPQVLSMFSLNDIKSESTPMRMYIIDLKRIVFFDEINYPENPRQEIIL